MQTDRFDHLTRTLSAAGTRRGLLQILLLPLTGGLAVLSLPDAAAKKRKAKKKCKKPCGPCATCKQGKCKQKMPDGTVCGPDQVCSSGACLVSACGAGGPCRVFLSSSLYTGALGGLSGADAKCQGLAAAVGLPGTYEAWLSDSTSSPSSRFMRSSGPYRLVTGTTIAANWAELTDGALLAPISVTETGGGVGANDGAWTNTLIDGNRASASEHCSNWSSNVSGNTGNIGRATSSNAAWTEHAMGACSALFYHLYCFQQS